MPKSADAGRAASCSPPRPAAGAAAGSALRSPPPFRRRTARTHGNRQKPISQTGKSGGRNGMFRLPRSHGARPAGPQAPPHGMETDYQSIQKAKSTSAAQTRPFSAFIIAQKAPHGKDNFWYLRKSFSAARFRPLSGERNPGKPRILAGKDTGSAAASSVVAAASGGVSPSVGCTDSSLIRGSEGVCRRGSGGPAVGFPRGETGRVRVCGRFPADQPTIPLFSMDSTKNFWQIT